MILLREVQERDIESLERLATIPGFINLQNDRDFLKEKITRSTASFHDQLPDKWEAKYVFIAEDLDSGRVLGTSMIAAQHGTAEAPHFYFEVGNEEKISATINTGFIHGTLKLKYDTNGPSEIGGLVLDNDARNNTEARVGRQISFIRFMYLGLNKPKFKRKILAELLPPLNKKGQSPLWEAVGRRFTNMDYWEADQLCQKNKEFIFSLFPSGKIYTTFLPAEARNAIGKVGKETEPVVHMLNKIGFTYKNQVDPFDGGPHLWANVDEIVPIKKLVTAPFDATPLAEAKTTDAGLLSKANQRPGTFRAIAVHAQAASGRIQLTAPDVANAQKALAAEPGEPLVFMPYY